MAKWCISIREYAEALKIIKPKQARLKEMTDKYQESMKVVEAKEKELQDIKNKLQELENDF